MEPNTLTYREIVRRALTLPSGRIIDGVSEAEYRLWYRTADAFDDLRPASSIGTQAEARDLIGRIREAALFIEQW